MSAKLTQKKKNLKTKEAIKSIQFKHIPTLINDFLKLNDYPLEGVGPKLARNTKLEREDIV